MSSNTTQKKTANQKKKKMKKQTDDFVEITPEEAKEAEEAATTTNADEKPQPSTKPLKFKSVKGGLGDGENWVLVTEGMEVAKVKRLEGGLKAPENGALPV